MAMESSIEDKQLDDDYILDGMETSEADVQTASTTEQLMAVIDRLRQENAALMTGTCLTRSVFLKSKAE